MKVVEIFESIQGEGHWMGNWCTFVRLAGCNLKCSFCDEASKYGKATEMSVDEIVSQVHTTMVVITGGEPTIQEFLPDLICALHKQHHRVHIETNGTGSCVFLGEMRPDWVTVSPKEYSGFVIDTRPDEIKFVVNETLSFDEILNVHSDWPDCTIWLQPCDSPSSEARNTSKNRIIDWLSQFGDGRSWLKAGIQLHKYYGER